jgi:hypothetical protein
MGTFKRWKMSHRVVIIFVVMGLVACGEQPSDSVKPTQSEALGPEVGKIRAVQILPENPSSTTDVEAQVLFRGERAKRLSYQWMKNGIPIPGAIQATLSHRYFDKGDFISVQVRVSGPGARQDPFISDEIVVGNTPPVIGWVGIEPFGATATDDLNSIVESKDRDGDDVSYAYQWSVNGQTLVGQERPTLASNFISRGDEVQVEVTPFDGSNWGNPVTSPVAVIENSAPTIVSTPPKRVVEGTTYRYEVKAEDPDGDPLRYSLGGNPPPGMKIDSTSGVVTWDVVVPDEAVTYVYEVNVVDSEGAGGKQEITLKFTP